MHPTLPVRQAQGGVELCGMAHHFIHHAPRFVAVGRRYAELLDLLKLVHPVVGGGAVACQQQSPDPKGDAHSRVGNGHPLACYKKKIGHKYAAHAQPRT